MLCQDCRFSLVCFAGRLDASDEDGGVCICPACQRLSILRTRENALYLLRCERRYHVPAAAMALWRGRREDARGAVRPVIMQIPVDDHGPGLRSKLLVRECNSCAQRTGGARPWVTPPGFKYVDLDEEATTEEELRPNPLGLRCGR